MIYWKSIQSNFYPNFPQLQFPYPPICSSNLYNQFIFYQQPFYPQPTQSQSVFISGNNFKSENIQDDIFFSESGKRFFENDDIFNINQSKKSVFHGADASYFPSGEKSDYSNGNGLNPRQKITKENGNDGVFLPTTIQFQEPRESTFSQLNQGNSNSSLRVLASSSSGVVSNPRHDPRTISELYKDSEHQYNSKTISELFEEFKEQERSSKKPDGIISPVGGIGSEKIAKDQLSLADKSKEFLENTIELVNAGALELRRGGERNVNLQNAFDKIIEKAREKNINKEDLAIIAVASVASIASVVSEDYIKSVFKDRKEFNEVEINKAVAVYFQGVSKEDKLRVKSSYFSEYSEADKLEVEKKLELAKFCAGISMGENIDSKNISNENMKYIREKIFSIKEKPESIFHPISADRDEKFRLV